MHLLDTGGGGGARWTVVAHWITSKILKTLGKSHKGSHRCGVRAVHTLGLNPEHTHPAVPKSSTAVQNPAGASKAQYFEAGPLAKALF